jgi:succinate dehydrogenase/fumarate reductase flavoprotein subunit
LTAVAAPQPGSRPPDVLVVGAGISGLSAALEAARGEARVKVVEMWSIFGGHAVMSEGGLAIVGSPTQQAQGVVDSPDLAFRDFVQWGEDADPDWVRYYVENSRSEIYDWLTAMGVSFDVLRPLPGNSVPRFHRVRGRGLNLVSPIYQECVKNPLIEFEWNLKLASLVVENARVVGVRTEELRTGHIRELRARNVILATGGFQSNLEMVRTYWPQSLPFPERMLAGSGVNSQGSGLEAAARAGAALHNMDHQWNYVTGLPDPRYPGLNRGLNASNVAAIWVNAQGRRFTAEYGSPKQALPALLKQTRRNLLGRLRRGLKAPLLGLGLGLGRLLDDRARHLQQSRAGQVGRDARGARHADGPARRGAGGDGSPVQRAGRPRRGRRLQEIWSGTIFAAPVERAAASSEDRTRAVLCRAVFPSRPKEHGRRED